MGVVAQRYIANNGLASLGPGPRRQVAQAVLKVLHYASANKGTAFFPIFAREGCGNYKDTNKETEKREGVYNVDLVNDFESVFLD